MGNFDSDDDTSIRKKLMASDGPLTLILDNFVRLPGILLRMIRLTWKVSFNESSPITILLTMRSHGHLQTGGLQNDDDKPDKIKHSAGLSVGNDLITYPGASECSMLPAGITCDQLSLWAP